MCVTQRQNGKYELLNINDAHKIYKDEIETLYKSKYQSKVTKYSPFEAAGQENIINNELNKIQPQNAKNQAQSVDNDQILFSRKSDDKKQ